MLCDAKASYEYGDSVSFSESHSFFTSNLDLNCWLVFVFRDYPEIALVRVTSKFVDFLKSNGCYKSNCIAVNYKQTKDFSKDAGDDVRWISNPDGLTFKEFFDNNWPKEDWEGLPEEELRRRTEEIANVCMRKLGTDIPC